FSLPSLGDTRRTCAKVGPEPALGRRIGSWPVLPGHVWRTVPTCADLRKRALREKHAPIDARRTPRSSRALASPGELCGCAWGWTRVLAAQGHAEGDEGPRAWRRDRLLQRGVPPVA